MNLRELFWPTVQKKVRLHKLGWAYMTGVLRSWVLSALLYYLVGIAAL